MKKWLGILILCITAVSSLSAAVLTATITEVAGKVECKLPGTDWKTAKAGDILPAGSLISTGFKSTAILKTESATLTVKPVTRLTLEELIKSEGTTKTQMFLMAGRVKAEVTPHKGEKAEFKVKSPTATASVRGTGFEFDGKNLLVDHGSVLLEAESGIGVPQVVASGEWTSVNNTGLVSVPVAVATRGLSSNAIVAAVSSASPGNSPANILVSDTLSIEQSHQPHPDPQSKPEPDQQPEPEPNPQPEPEPNPEPEPEGDITIGIGWED